MKEFKKARVILDKSGLDVRAPSKIEEDLGFLGNNLVQGAVDPLGRRVVTGVCFPKRPTLQSVFPLLAVKDLLDNNRIDTAYVALPVFAYAGAGLPRRKQYLEILGLMKKLYGDDLGEKIFIIPDSREEVMRMKYMAANLTSRFVSDEPGQEKYPFNNLFRFFETASYGADILVAALAEQQDSMIVCDFRQFESIHAGNKMGKAMNKKIGALLYTLLTPVYENGNLREVSQDNGITHDKETIVPETSALFYQAAVLFPPEQVVELYKMLREGRSIPALEEKVAEAKRKLFAVTPMYDFQAQALEEVSMARIKPVEKVLDHEMKKRMLIEDRYAKNSRLIYEYK